MALITQFTTCPLCGESVWDATDDEIVATTHFIADARDPLWAFSDAAMHYGCFQQWPHRQEFVAKYNQVMGHRVWGNGTRDHMRGDGKVESIPAGESPAAG